MAGGLPAMRRAKEFAEDHADEGIKDLQEKNFSNKDLLIGVAASGRTPYVKEAMRYAREIGATTGSISCVSNAEISELADYPIEVVTGQEVVLGSTRMKAGTAEKLTLNLISTAAFIRLGHTYKNLLIADKGHPTTEKAYYRVIRMIAQETEKDEEEVKKDFSAPKVVQKFEIYKENNDIEDFTDSVEVHEENSLVENTIEEKKGFFTMIKDRGQ